MPAKDLYHDHVRQALENDGWTITDDPYGLKWGRATLQIDLAAERLIAAEKDDRKIAVEIKSFVGRSQVDDLENALGQLVLYRYLLRKQEPERLLYLAVHTDVFASFLSQPHVESLLQEETIRLIVFEPRKKEIVKWINWTNTGT
ncbi:MAG: XisH family protein [Blastocatellia bacterium]|nr:XisH family protein [Blastocatellia bacterium]